MSNVVIQRRVAYAVVHTPNDNQYRIAIAEWAVADYVIDPAEPPFRSYFDADVHAKKKNAAINLSPNEAWDIVSSSMSASKTLGKHWAPRGA